MDILIIEGSIDIIHDFLDHVPSKVESRIELTHIDAVAVQSDVLVFWTAAPGTSVSRRVDFRDDSNSSYSCVVDDGFDIFRRDESSDTAIFA